MATWLNLTLQDSASPVMEQLIFFHDHALMIMLMIITAVFYTMISIIQNKQTSRFILEGQMIETLWTIAPAIILVFIAIPSLRLLYLMDEIHNPVMTLKTVGHQWYWSYEYSDFTKLEFDSYMVQQEDQPIDAFRLLDTDNRVVLPMNSPIRIIVTAADVLHSWTVPSLGVKTDATPGRLNQMSFSINRPGLLYGQCSEICGANHSFMPIVIESVSTNQFINWVSKMSE
uniref:Cytochrome c oxidase subunit 2 n=19 Tax=Nasutitermitinae TaxID=62941 RepID=A0A1S5VUB7_9NEOP|nr:cytochrome c oxidase subunit II [Nasutitermes graveolus]YP_009350639.1 cytochrome c oxidase subunit II [Nasutitermes longipennis]YP_009351133.1 cytochrome c oxidase subunit II [Tumulitermes pastinator]YP_009351354.1 cytochrome c oxidase subunit II [Nasutitermes exitiosus]ABF73321.1 cytochrome oxidase subunit II [Nasutitermes graveolus]AQP26964.1 cytochrome c oxidase subunit 2 [Nasutitermes graveolus]AQP27526.1 cytochrome c oxidase subunit 2 [Nasutitermes longipennis]AQP28646.1 cytochrome 